jgi:hypothetical protein
VFADHRASGDSSQAKRCHTLHPGGAPRWPKPSEVPVTSLGTTSAARVLSQTTRAAALRLGKNVSRSRSRPTTRLPRISQERIAFPAAPVLFPGRAGAIPSGVAMPRPGIARPTRRNLFPSGGLAIPRPGSSSRAELARSRAAATHARRRVSLYPYN